MLWLARDLAGVTPCASTVMVCHIKVMLRNYLAVAFQVFFPFYGRTGVTTCSTIVLAHHNEMILRNYLERYNISRVSFLF